MQTFIPDRKPHCQRKINHSFRDQKDETESGEETDCQSGVLGKLTEKMVDKDHIKALVKKLFEECQEEYCLTITEIIVQSRWDEVNRWALKEEEELRPIREEREKRRLEEARKLMARVNN